MFLSQMLFTVGSLTLTLFALLSVTFITFYFYFTRNFKLWQKLGIPYVKPTPFFGNLMDCAIQKVNIGKHLQRIYNEHSDKPYVGIFTFDKPSLLIRDPELVKNILVKDSQYFINRTINFNDDLDPLFGLGLFVIKGKRWRHLRLNLNPVFTSGKIKKMFCLVDMCGKDLDDYLQKATANGSPLDVKETMAKYTTDVIASCAFGINGNSLKDPDAGFRGILRNIFDFSVRKGLAGLTASYAPAIKSFLKLKFMNDDTANYLRNTVWSTVEYREKNGVVRNDFLDCMIQLRNKEQKEFQETTLSANDATQDPTFQIDGDIFVAQAFVFLAGGYETSATTLAFTLYELALHPEIQIRLRAEILQVLNKHNGEVTYDGIQEMSYLDMVVSETLRKYPAAPILDRMCCSDYKLPAPSGHGTVTLPAGTGVYIPLVGLHHDPTYFPEPEKFDPERFTEENKRSRPNYTYLPFGDGPRICIGLRFGLMQVKTGLSHILSRFEVALCKDTPLPIVFDTKSFFLEAKGEIPLSFTRVHQ